jgi:orotidine-5'-phosphate decarboxylase
MAGGDVAERTADIPPVLRAALAAGKVPVSVGLEPSAEYLPSGNAPTIAGRERFLELLIEATADRVAAFKLNAAFFESLGPDGAALLARVRDMIPADTFVIYDAKRGDIGSTAKHYAAAAFEVLRSHAVTVNPLMGRDAVAPFLAYPDTLTYVLCLTSNPGATDLLTRRVRAAAGDDGERDDPSLFSAIASRGAQWSDESASADGGRVGFVVGATNAAERLDELASTLRGRPLLVPGIGAQGGEAQPIIERFGDPRGTGTLFHVTRGVLPTPDDEGDAREVVARKLRAFVDALGLDRGHLEDETTRAAPDAAAMRTEAS